MIKFIWPRDRLTRFEVARLIGARALQISLGAPVFVQSEKLDPIEISKEEFRKMILPITVKRKLPNGEEIIIDIKKAVKNWLETYKDF